MSKLPPASPGQSARGPNHEAQSASTRTCSCCRPRRCGRTAANKVLVAGPASATRRSSTRPPGSGRTSLTSPTRAAAAVERPLLGDGVARPVGVDGGDAGRAARWLGRGRRHAPGPGRGAPRRPRDGRGARPGRPGRRVERRPGSSSAHHRAGPLQHGPAARRRDLSATAAATGARTTRSTPTRSTPPSCWDARAGGWRRRGRRGGRAHLPLDVGAAARRARGVGRRRPRHRERPLRDILAGRPHGPDLVRRPTCSPAAAGSHVGPGRRPVRRRRSRVDGRRRACRR